MTQETQPGSADTLHVRGHARIVDKYPFNFIHVAMIRLALSNARFIQSRRAPVEICCRIFPGCSTTRLSATISVYWGAITTPTTR